MAREDGGMGVIDAFVGILMFFGSLVSFLVSNVGFVLLVVLVFIIWRAMRNAGNGTEEPVIIEQPTPKMSSIVHDAPPAPEPSEQPVLTEAEIRKIHADRIRARKNSQ